MYDVNYFIEKFEAVHSQCWVTEMGYGKNKIVTCAMGFCGGYTEDSKESEALSVILCEFYTIIGKGMPQNCGNVDLNAVVYFLNDDPYIINLPTPKERILHALYTIRDKELSEANLNAAKEIIEVEK